MFRKQVCEHRLHAFAGAYLRAGHAPHRVYVEKHPSSRREPDIPSERRGTRMQ